jgi:hypothetical protein
MIRHSSLALIVGLLGLALGCGGKPPAAVFDEDAGTDTDTAAGDGDADGDTDGDGDTDTGSMPANTWTLMMYEDADNNLESDLLKDVNEMEMADIPENVNVIVLLDRTPGTDASDGDWKGTKLFRISHDEDMSAIHSERLADPEFLGLTADSPDGEELNMGDPATLDGFIRFCQKAYPAANYIMHFSDHGSGWSKKKALAGGTGTVTEPVRGTCADDTSDGDELTLSSEVPQAMAGKGIISVSLDACITGTIEVAWALKDVATYFTASVMTIPGPGFAYTEFLNAWFADMTPEGWGLVAVDEFIKAYAGQQQVGLSTVDLREVPAFGEALAPFLEGTKSAAAADLKAAKNAAYRPDPLLNDQMADFDDFVTRCASYVPAGTTEALIAAQDAMVMSYEYSADLSKVRSLIVYAPKKSWMSGGYDSKYDETPFAKDTGWGEFVKPLVQ